MYSNSPSFPCSLHSAFKCIQSFSFFLFNLGYCFYNSKISILFFFISSIFCQYCLYSSFQLTSWSMLIKAAQNLYWIILTSVSSWCSCLWLSSSVWVWVFLFLHMPGNFSCVLSILAVRFWDSESCLNPLKIVDSFVLSLNLVGFRLKFSSTFCAFYF